MKRLLIVLAICFFYSEILVSQLLGDGTAANPFRGTVTGSEIWDVLHPDYSLWGWDEWGNKVIYVCRNAAGSRDLIINSGASVTLGAGFAMVVQGISSKITINPSGVFSIEPGGYAKTFSIVNNGLIRLRSDEYGIPSLYIQTLYGSNYTGSGTCEETIFLTGGTTPSGGNKWHFISTPIDQVAASVFTGTSPNWYTQNLARYIEPIVQSDNSAGWIAFDGYVYNDPLHPNPAYAFNYLDIGTGYNYYSIENASRTFAGTLNYSDVGIEVTRGSGYTDQGYNLIGNPFPSVLDWDYVTDYSGIPDQIDNAIYFTVDDAIASYVDKVAAGGATDWGSIPPMQGFFVHVNTPTDGVILTIPSQACTIDPYQFRYKGNAGGTVKTSSSIPLVRIKFENKKDSDDLVIRFNEKATGVFDKKFDAYKFNKTAKSIGTWSTMGNVDYSINGLPYPETILNIPIGIYISTSGIHKLSSNELHNLDGYAVTLKDLATNITVDLNNGGIMQFDAPSGIIEDRFILSITNLTTDIPAITTPERKFSIYSSQGNLNILSMSDELSNLPGSVTIYDLTGRKVQQVNNLEWNGKGDLKQFAMNPAEKGMFIVEVKAGNNKYVEKVNINK